MPADGETFLFTSESVNEGHPDKLCDQVRGLAPRFCRETLTLVAPTCGAPTAHPHLEADSRATLSSHQVSDSILDACLEQDPYSKVSCRPVCRKLLCCGRPF